MEPKEARNTDLPESAAFDATIAQLRQTLAAQGIGDTHAANATMGATPMPASVPPAARSTLPEVHIGSGGEFEPVKELGRGGVGVVELATQRSLDREVAIKRLLNSSPAMEHALLHEAIIAGQLEHPNIVPVHAVVATDAGPAVVMKRISGTEWQALLDAGDTPLDRHLEIFMQVCSAAAFAHSRGIVHRDIKPANVMIGEFGEVYLVDWGLARRLVGDALPSGRVVGTPAYMAPEMVNGEADMRSDVYLLGATLHEVLTGSVRNHGGSLMEVLRAAHRATPHRYDEQIPAELGATCNRACKRDREGRYGSVSALRDAVGAYLDHRAAHQLGTVAEGRFGELQQLTDSDVAYAKVQRVFSEARFAFEEAIKAWPESMMAKAGRDACLRHMLRYELSLAHAENAAALYESLGTEDPSLYAEIEAVRATREAERSRLSKLERDRDPNEGAAARGKASFALAAGVIALVAAFSAARVLAPNYAPHNVRLVFVGAVVFLVGVGVIRMWRRNTLNLINRRISQIIFGTLALSLFNRILGLLRDTGVAEVLTTDALVLLGGGLALLPFHRAGRWLALSAGAIATVGTFQGAWLQPMFLALAVGFPLVFLIQRKLVHRATAQHETTPTSTSENEAERGGESGT